MKKLLTGIVSLAILLGGTMLYTKNASNEFAAIIDQLNPLVPRGEVYVKTQKPVSVNGYGTAAYKQLASSPSGKTRTIEFNGISELKTDRYLKLSNKGAHVETYEEVPKEEVPKEALKQID